MDKHKRAILIAVPVMFLIGVALIALSFWSQDEEPSETITPTLIEAAASATATDPPAPPTPESPQIYVVQEGDTLGQIAEVYDISIDALLAANEIADPNVLHVGQTLIIPPAGPTPLPTTPASPEPSPTAKPSAGTIPTLTPSGPTTIGIAQVLGSGNPATEVVIIRNRGSMVSLESWTLSNEKESSFTFPALTLFPGVEIRVHSGVGEDTPRDLYWGRQTAAWSGGELITLQDAAGNVVDTYIVP